MKTLYAIVFLMGMGLVAQENKTSKKEYLKEGNQTRYVEYHDNGVVAQTGLFKNEELHGRWISYDEEGNKVMMGNYDVGKKTSKWLFWQKDVLIEVDYDDNKIVRSVQWNNATLIAEN